MTDITFPSDPAGLTTRTILDFIDDGHNVIIGADSSVASTTRDVASECGVEFDEEGTFVIDHFNYDVSDASGDHTLVVSGKAVAHCFACPFPPSIISKPHNIFF